MSDYDPNPAEPSAEQPSSPPLREALWRLILMRETGPKSAAWHRARMRVIWRIHDRLGNKEQRTENNSEEREG